KVCDEATGERSEGAARFATGIRSVLSGEMDQFIFDYPCDAADKARWFVARVSSFTDEKPRRSVVVSHMDITDRKRTEKALQEARDLLEQRVEERTIQLREEIEAHKRLQVTLQESEEKFRTVADWTYNWEYWIDPQERVLRYISPSVERVTGYGPEAFLADSGLMDRIVHPDDRLLWDLHMQKDRIKPDAVEEQVFRIITARGEVRWIGHVCQAVTAADGRPLGRRVSNRDITRQKLAEEALRKSEERLQLAITAADVGIWEWDVVSNRLTWDATMCRFYGITPDEFGGSYKAWETAIHPEDLPKMQSAVQRELLGGSDFSAEFRIIWPDGSIHWMKANARIERDPEGRAVRVTGTNLDITGDKLLVEAAEAASRAKSLFIGNMSHELRTPLSGVLGMTEALLNTPVTQQQRDYAETIRKSGKALLAVVSDILDFSKISAGNMALESSPFLVESVIVSVVNLFGPPAAEEKIALHTVIDPELPAVRGDVHRLTQVVSNLVGNAVKFTKAGEIRVSVKILQRTEAEVDLAISVQDTGIGMTEEEISRLFTPFTQGDTTTA
ncbi:MAG: PAS domain-containing protein, partial [Deltaproteobacteria bacterium]